MRENTRTRTELHLSASHLPDFETITSTDLLSRKAVSTFLSNAPRAIKFNALAALLQSTPPLLRAVRLSKPDTEIAKNHVAIALTGDAETSPFSGVLLLEKSLIQMLLQRMLGRSIADQSVLSTGEQGALLYALDKAAGDVCAAGLTGFALRGMLFAPEDTSNFLQQCTFHLNCELALETNRWGVHLLGGPFNVNKAIERSFALDNALTADWPLQAHPVIGTTCITAAELQTVAIGDLVTIDRLCPLVAHPLANSEFHPYLRCGTWQVDILWRGTQHIEVTGETGYEPNMNRNEKNRNTLEKPAEINPEGQMEMVLHVEAGSVTMSVRDILALMPGTVIPLHRPPDNGVVLRSNSRIVARGTLVRAGDDLAVEIEEIL